MNDTQLTKIEDNNRMSMTNLDDMKKWYNDFVQFSQEILKKDLDYGVIPGVSKPSLYKPGAEKLRFVYGLGVEVNLTSKTEDFDRGYIDYTYKAIVRGKNGQVIAECEGNANSYESKWRYTWVLSDKKPSKEEAEQLKAKKLGRWTKQGNDWVWLEKEENKDVFGNKNTLMKMAQKRAFVGAVLIATGASEFFTQDVEDMELFTGVIEATTVEPEPTNKYKKTLDALLASKAITKDQYDDVVGTEEETANFLKKLKAEREENAKH